MKFVDSLPPAYRGKTAWEIVASSLAERPGQWAFIRSYVSDSSASLAVRNQHGRNGLEVVRRGRDVYARWIGEKEMPK